MYHLIHIRINYIPHNDISNNLHYKFDNFLSIGTCYYYIFELINVQST